MSPFCSLLFSGSQHTFMHQFELGYYLNAFLFSLQQAGRSGIVFVYCWCMTVIRWLLSLHSSAFRFQTFCFAASYGHSTVHRLVSIALLIRISDSCSFFNWISSCAKLDRNLIASVVNNRRSEPSGGRMIETDLIDFSTFFGFVKRWLYRRLIVRLV